MYHWRERLTNNQYFYHYLFWAIVLLSYVVDAAELRHFNPHLFFRTLILKNGLLIAIVYFHLRVLIPLLLVPKRYRFYAVGLLLTIGGGTFLTNRAEHYSWRQFYAQEYLLSPHHDAENGQEKMVVQEEVITSVSPQNRMLLDTLTVCRYLVISILLKFIDDFFRQREQLQQAQYEKTMAELNALKAQINPHFLFNTLNNLYGLVLEKSDLAAETLLKLSDMMKYTVAEGNAASVPLEKDLDNLRHYFDLECLRLPEQADVHFIVNGILENQRITPLLILPLLENAFKYGVYRSREHHYLKIEIDVQGNDLSVEIQNQKPDPKQFVFSFGTGLQNVRKRLDLLYPNRYRFEITENNQYFRVHLQLEL